MILRIFQKKKAYVHLFLENTPEAMQVCFVGSSRCSSIQEVGKFLKTMFLPALICLRPLWRKIH